MKWLRRDRPGPPEVFGKAADRSHESDEGADTWSDPVTGAGSLLAVTELLLAPDAVHAWPVERDADVLTWVVAGTLTHEDEGGVVTAVAGTLLHGSADATAPRSGADAPARARHRDRNTGTGELRLIRFLVRRDGAPRSACAPVTTPTLVPGGGMFEVLTQRTELEAAALQVHVIDGAFSVAGTPLRPGDWVRLSTTGTLEGEGTALAWASSP